jgi:ABC-type dipeptide/oligopeptide/nickel transport system ATPase component
MRTAKAQDHWRRVFDKNRSTSIVKFDFTDVYMVGSGRLEALGGISAFCGANGAGKTSLLGTLFRCLAGPSTDEPQGMLTRASDSAKVAARLRGEEFSFPAPTSDAEDLIIALDPAELASRLIRALRALDNTEELLAQYEERLLTHDEMNELSYVVGRRYTSVTVREVEGVLEGMITPYFSVVTETASYSSAGMGQGELAAHVLLWHLRGCKPASILVLEEPETFLPPRAQKSLMNTLAKYADERNICIVLSTHSPFILQSIPPDSIYILCLGEVASARERTHYLQALGVSSPIDGMIFVEDHAGRCFLRNLLRQQGAFDLLSRYSIEVSGSESGVVSALRGLPAGGKLSFCGVMDGDSRKRYSKLVGKHRPEAAVCFLPSNQSPDSLVLDSARAKYRIFAKAVRVTERRCRQALSETEGSDEHDAIAELGRKLEVTYEEVFSACFQAWTRTKGVAQLVREFMADLRAGLRTQEGR